MVEIVNDGGRVTIVRNQWDTFNVVVDQLGCSELFSAEVVISQDDLCKFVIAVVGQLKLSRTEMMQFVIKMAETASGTSLGEASDG